MAGFYDTFGDFHALCPDCNTKLDGPRYAVTTHYTTQNGKRKQVTTEAICGGCAKKRESYWAQGGHRTWRTEVPA